MCVVSERIARLRPSVVREILAAATSPGVISFAGGLPAAESFPELSMAEVGPALRQYGLTEGEPELRAAVAEYLKGIGHDVPAERIMLTHGSQQGIDLVAKLFIDLGSSVLTESPTYLAALQVFHLFGAHTTGIPLGPQGISVDRLRAHCSSPQAKGSAAPRFLYAVPTFQNPTGAVWSEPVREQVAALLDEVGLPIVEDEPYRELAFDGDRPVPVSARLKRAPFVYLGSFSKSFVPGLRLGYLAASEELFTVLVRLKQAADLHSNRVSQGMALAELQSAGHLERMARLRELYRGRRDSFEVALERHFGDLARWQAPRGGLFFWVELKNPIDTAALLPAALERGVAFVPGVACYPESEAQSVAVGAGSTTAAVSGHHHFMRLNFSHATAEQANEGLARLASLIREQGRR